MLINKYCTVTIRKIRRSGRAVSGQSSITAIHCGFCCDYGFCDTNHLAIYCAALTAYNQSINFAWIFFSQIHLACEYFNSFQQMHKGPLLLHFVAKFDVMKVRKTRLHFTFLPLLFFIFKKEQYYVICCSPWKSKLSSWIMFLLFIEL